MTVCENRVVLSWPETTPQAGRGLPAVVNLFYFKQSVCSLTDGRRRQIPRKRFPAWVMGVCWFLYFLICIKRITQHYISVKTYSSLVFVLI